MRRWGLAVALALMGGAALAQDRVTIGHTGVSLVPPAGWEAAEGFDGLTNPEGTANLGVDSAEASLYDSASDVFATIESADKEFGGEDGIKVDAVSSVKGETGTIYYLHGRQTLNDVEIEKWVASAGGDATALINFNSLPGLLQTSDVEAMLKTVEIETFDEMLAAMPFTAETKAPFQMLRGNQSDNLAMIGPQGDDPDMVAPTIIIDCAFNLGDIPDSKGVSEELLRSVSGFEEIKLDDQKAVTFAALPGYYLEGLADDPDSGGIVRVGQWISVTDGNFVRMIAFAPPAQFEQLHDTIDSIAATVKFQ